MTPQQLAVLRANMISNGLIAATATDDQIVAAANSMQNSNPDQLAQLMATGPSWLMVIGLGVGAVALYMGWQYFTKTKKLGEVYEEDEPVDHRPQLRGFSKSLSRFKGVNNSRSSSMAACRAKTRRMGRGRGLGDADYEFEPEIRLEGMRRGKRVRR